MPPPRKAVEAVKMAIDEQAERLAEIASSLEDESEEPAEEVIQFSLSLRKGLRKQLARLADEADMTMRAFVLDALKAKGLDVRPEDLADLRKERR